MSDLSFAAVFVAGIFALALLDSKDGRRFLGLVFRILVCAVFGVIGIAAYWVVRDHTPDDPPIPIPVTCTLTAGPEASVPGLKMDFPGPCSQPTVLAATPAERTDIYQQSLQILSGEHLTPLTP